MHAIEREVDPGRKQLRFERRFLCPREREHLGLVGPFGRRHADLLRARGENCLADVRILDQIQHVGGVAPELVTGDCSHLPAQLPPRERAVAAMALGVGRAQAAGEGLLKRLVQDQSVAGVRHERKRKKGRQRFDQDLALAPLDRAGGIKNTG